MKQPPTCHPDRPHLARGLCRACYMKKWKTPQALPPRENNWDFTPDRFRATPGRVPGVKQNAVTTFPIAECPKCHGHLFAYNGREAHCAGHLGGCGATYYLTAPYEMESFKVHMHPKGALNVVEHTPKLA